MNHTHALYLDGINISFEGSAFTKDIKMAITQLTKEAFTYFKNADPNYAVTFDIPYSPYLAGCLESYCYDFIEISKYTDYNANIDIFVAQANSLFYLIEEGINFYVKNLSINPNNLVMAVPWYGYDFTCKSLLNRTGNELCVITGATHLQRNNKAIEEIIREHKSTVKFNEFSKSAFFTVVLDGHHHQIWFDTSETLAYKFDLAIKLGLRGMSMWQSDALDYTSTDPAVVKKTKEYWDNLTGVVIQLKGN